MSALLDIAALRAGYGNVPVVHDIELHVDAGEIVTVIGSNGAGKTTLLNAIMGVLPAQGGITLAGQPLAALNVEERVAAGISLVSERRELFGPMSVEDNLVLGGWLHRGRRDGTGIADIFALFPRLAERRRQAAQTLSGGERQMLAIGRALMARPRVLLLDEPSLGLAPRIVADMLGNIAALRARGVAVLLVEQNARAALRIADRGYVMELGRIALAGSSSALAGDERIARLYLGHRLSGESAISPVISACNETNKGSDKNYEKCDKI
jgi:branched-chain amino acid transport system ATP-binding protein